MSKDKPTIKEVKQNISMQEWIEYVAIQETGMFNMLDPQAREMTDISRDKWVYILTNYSSLREAYNG